MRQFYKFRIIEDVRGVPSGVGGVLGIVPLDASYTRDVQGALFHGCFFRRDIRRTLGASSVQFPFSRLAHSLVPIARTHVTDKTTVYSFYKCNNNEQ